MITSHSYILVTAMLLVSIVSPEVQGQSTESAPTEKKELMGNDGSPGLSREEQEISAQDVMLRSMRDVYHGWSTSEGMWAPSETNRLDEALRSEGDIARNVRTLATNGLIPRSEVVKWLQLRGEEQNLTSQIRAAQEAAEEKGVCGGISPSSRASTPRSSRSTAAPRDPLWAHSVESHQSRS